MYSIRFIRRFFVCFVRRQVTCPGKEIMRTPREFDYLLWTEKGDTTRYYVKLKATGETIEVSREVMRCLRNEEKKIRRAIESEAENQIVSLEQTSEDYLINDGFESDVIVGMIESEMIKTLTYRQKVVYDACIRKGIPMSEFAVENGVSKQSVQHALKFIRKKSKKYLK